MCHCMWNCSTFVYKTPLLGVQERSTHTQILSGVYFLDVGHTTLLFSAGNLQSAIQKFCFFFWCTCLILESHWIPTMGWPVLLSVFFSMRWYGTCCFRDEYLSNSHSSKDNITGFPKHQGLNLLLWVSKNLSLDGCHKDALNDFIPERSYQLAVNFYLCFFGGEEGSEVVMPVICIIHRKITWKRNELYFKVSENLAEIVEILLEKRLPPPQFSTRQFWHLMHRFSDIIIKSMYFFN